MVVDISSATNWADEVGEEFDKYSSKAYTDDKGLKVFIEYKKNDDGKMVKVTRKVKMTLKKEQVNKAVAARKKWAKFGDERNSPPGPNLQTTSVGEQIFLKLSANQNFQEEDEDKQKDQLKGKKILCRICKGDHFTTKCPYKDTLQPLDETAAAAGSNDAKDDGNAAGGKYMAPHMRRSGGNVESAGESMRDKRDDSASLRVTNLSEDTRESDLHDLFRKFGHIARVFLAKDHETGLCKGFAFVSFSLREEAAKAREALDGHGYDNLILRVDWSQPNTK